MSEIPNWAIDCGLDSNSYANLAPIDAYNLMIQWQLIFGAAEVASHEDNIQWGESNTSGRSAFVR